MKDSDLAERAKQEKVARTARDRAEAFAKGTLLELLESMPSDDKAKFASKGIIFPLSSIVNYKCQGLRIALVSIELAWSSAMNSSFSVFQRSLRANRMAISLK